jgi:hypothetical protein
MPSSSSPEPAVESGRRRPDVCRRQGKHPPSGTERSQAGGLGCRPRAGGVRQLRRRSTGQPGLESVRGHEVWSPRPGGRISGGSRGTRGAGHHGLPLGVPRRRCSRRCIGSKVASITRTRSWDQRRWPRRSCTRSRCPDPRRFPRSASGRERTLPTVNSLILPSCDVRRPRVRRLG